jgi:peptidoglycan/LPS O-acetylase OafA/YrhL
VEKPGSTINPPRLWSLDALRGICAGIVFLSHWHLWANFTPQGSLERFIRAFGEQLYNAVSLATWPTGGQHPAVIGFFVLSGFCIHYPFEYRNLHGIAEVNWRDYTRRRFLRIVPAYWAACSIGLVLVIAESYRPSGDPLLTLHASGTITDIVVRFAGLAGIYPHEIIAGNYILTTVSVEILMYALYPLFYYFARRGRWLLLGGVFLILQLGGVVFIRYLNPFWLFNSVPMLGIFWYAGALAAHLFLTNRDRVTGLALFTAWAVFIALKLMPSFTGLNLLKQAAWGIVCVLGILWILRIEQRRPLLKSRPLIAIFGYLCDLSYSLYATHTPAIMLTTWALLQIGVRNYLVQLAATLVVSIIAALGVYYGIERRFYRPRIRPAEVALAQRVAVL